MHQLVPSNAKGQKVYHGCLAVPQSTATAADSRNPSDNDPDDGDGDDDDEGGGIYGNLTVHDDDTTAGPSRSGRDKELDVGSATGNATEASLLHHHHLLH